MPKLKVYKNNGVMIPVDDAKISSAYKCPWTGDLYATKKSYVKHLRILRETRMHARARENRWIKKMEDLWSQPTFQDIINWVERNPEPFWLNGKNRGWSSDAKQWDKIRDDFWIKVLQLKVHWSDNVSNTHNCPHNGVTNWGGRVDGAPRGYPGWRGDITFQVSHDVPSFFSNIFEGTRIHTGTGGARGEKTYSYSVIFFEDDWNGLSKRRVWNIVGSKPVNVFDYGY